MTDRHTRTLSCRQARDLDMVAYLARLGHTPIRIRRQDYWYFSPFREERTASFKINRRMNRWYDHGLGEGGNLVDFALRYHGGPLRERLQELAQASLLPVRPLPVAPAPAKPAPSLRIEGRYPLSSPALCRYLLQRGIPLQVAQRYCVEVRYALYGKHYRAIGFGNDAGGYELRSPHRKCSSSPKDISSFRRGSQRVAVFEGFLDFLSWQCLCPGAGHCDAIVLNSVALFARASPLLGSYQKVHLYLDNDAAGERCTRQGLSLGAHVTDERARYAGETDLNDWLVHRGPGLRTHG